MALRDGTMTHLVGVCRVASIMLNPVIHYLSSVHDEICRPLPRLPSTKASLHSHRSCLYDQSNAIS